LAEAARYLRLPAATLRSWVLGREYPTAEGGGEFPPLIRPVSKSPPLLSFPNLIEAHVLRSLRTEHGVPVKALRSALAYAEKTLGIDRLLLRPELRANAGKIFLDRYGELMDLSASGQLAMRQLFNEHLKRIELAASGRSSSIRTLLSGVRWWSAGAFPHPRLSNTSMPEKALKMSPMITISVKPKSSRLSSTSGRLELCWFHRSRSRQTIP
jgi:hypothetical protein